MWQVHQACILSAQMAQEFRQPAVSNTYIGDCQSISLTSFHVPPMLPAFTEIIAGSSYADNMYVHAR